MKWPCISTKLALLCPLLGLASCSKKSGDDAPNHEGSDRAGTAAINPAEADLPKNEDLPATKSGDPTPTVEEQRLKSVTQQIDQLEIQRKKFSLVEGEKRSALNKLRGVPEDTPIDITNPGVAHGSSLEGEKEAFNDYLMISLELQTLDAKEKLFKEQMQRLRDTRNQNRADGARETQK